MALSQHHGTALRNARAAFAAIDTAGPGEFTSIHLHGLDACLAISDLHSATAFDHRAYRRAEELDAEMGEGSAFFRGGVLTRNQQIRGTIAGLAHQRDLLHTEVLKTRANLEFDRNAHCQDRLAEVELHLGNYERAAGCCDAAADTYRRLSLEPTSWQATQAGLLEARALEIRALATAVLELRAERTTDVLGPLPAVENPADALGRVLPYPWES